MTTLRASAQPVWPSAFQRVEQPFYDLNEERNKFIQNKDQGINSRFQSFAWAMKQQYAYWHFVMLATPLSCLADVVAGIAETALSIYQGGPVASILQKKLIASPIQHLVFFSGNLFLPAIFGSLCIPAILKLNLPWLKGFIGVSTLIFGPTLGFLSYHLAQRAVGKLPTWARPEGFNIFINGGCLNPKGQKMTGY
jgi:hypothetical protein